MTATTTLEAPVATAEAEEASVVEAVAAEAAFVAAEEATVVAMITIAVAVIITVEAVVVAEASVVVPVATKTVTATQAVEMTTGVAAIRHGELVLDSKIRGDLSKRILVVEAGEHEEVWQRHQMVGPAPTRHPSHTPTRTKAPATAAIVEAKASEAVAEEAAHTSHPAPIPTEKQPQFTLLILTPTRLIVSSSILLDRNRKEF
jgi:hypothetical protein